MINFKEEFKKFILNDIFWFNKSELNFGIYKIFRQKEQVIKDKLDEIVANIEDELSSSNDKAIAELKDEIIEYIPPKKAKNISLDTLEDIEKTIQEYGNGDTDKLLAKLNILKSQDTYDSTKVYEYLYQFFNLYYEKGDFGYTKRSFRTYTVPYRYEEYLLEPQEKCVNENSYDIDYRGEETIFSWKTKDSYYIKSNKFLNSVSLNLSFQGKDYTINTNILAKDEDIKDDKKVKQYRLISVSKENDTITLNYNISDYATPKHTIYLVLLSVINQDIKKLNYDDIFKDENLKNYFEDLPFKDKPIQASLLDENQTKLIQEFKKLIEDEDITRYLLLSKKEKGKLKVSNIFSSELSGEEDKTQLKSKVSKLMLSKKDYASKIYTKTTAKEFLKLDKKTKFEFEDKNDIEKLYKEDKTLEFFYRLDRGINMFYAGVDSDYFIHKNLKRFLNVELDKFIKNYIFADTDALLLMDESAKKIATFARVFKTQAKVFIDLLSSIEEFQKYLWEKRKMVKTSEYIISSNKIEDVDILEKVLKNRDQLDEWKSLGITKPNEKPNILELQSHSYPIDTKHFTLEFKYKVLSLFENIEEELSGLLIKSENYQALRFLEPKYTTKKGEGKIKCIYIDPPYNTGNDGFVYKDNFKTASWLSMMSDRLEVAKTLMSDDGVIFTSIDDNEMNALKILINNTFDKDNYIIDFIWKKGKELEAYNVGIHHEYILCSTKYKNKVILNLQPKDTSRHKTKLSEANLVKGIESIYKDGELFQLINLTKQDDYELEIPLISNKTLKVKGYLHPDTLKKYIKEGRIFVGKKETAYVKSFLSNERDGSVTSSIIESDFGTTKKGGIEIKQMFDKKVFSYPKPTSLIKYIIKIASSNNDVILDFFAGSGTTPHAVINLNREDGGKRKFIAVEMNDYFETIILPRIKKVSFASEWKDGKPQNKDGYSGIFQYIELEQYDDIIDNLQVEDDKNIDYNSIDVSYIYEPDKNQINFRMENELKNPLNPNNQFDIFTSLLFHEALELINIKLKDNVLVATVKDKYENTCAVVLSNDIQKAKDKVASIQDKYSKIYTNISTFKTEQILAQTFKGK